VIRNLPGGGVASILDADLPRQIVDVEILTRFLAQLPEEKAVRLDEGETVPLFEESLDQLSGRSPIRVGHIKVSPVRVSFNLKEIMVLMLL